MPAKIQDVAAIKNGEFCRVVAGTHTGKAGLVQDCHASKTGHLTITVVQNDGVKFKTLARNARKMAAE
ncbi:MAG: RNA-binding protein [Pseudomonadota bacterium]|nr:RNA-binding protein [Pseudomonadota bacterium]